MEHKELDRIDYNQTVLMRDGRLGNLRGPPGPDGLLVMDFPDGAVQKIHYSVLRLLREQGGRVAEQ